MNFGSGFSRPFFLLIYIIKGVKMTQSNIPESPEPKYLVEFEKTQLDAIVGLLDLALKTHGVKILDEIFELKECLKGAVPLETKEHLDYETELDELQSSE
jgi:hypothetical protein